MTELENVDGFYFHIRRLLKTQSLMRNLEKNQEASMYLFVDLWAYLRLHASV